MSLGATGGAPPSTLITAAASGIGRATARLFAERGWRVLACDRHAEALQDVIRLGGSGVVAVVGDVSTARALATSEDSRATRRDWPCRSRATGVGN